MQWLDAFYEAVNEHRHFNMLLGYGKIGDYF
jgi:hypothetical protein